MLESLHLENYRCFDKHEVPFHELTVVVGANNAGKSTLVEAIRLLGLVVGRYRGLTYERPPAWTELSGRLRGVSPSMGDLDLRGGSVFHRYGSPPAVVTAQFTNGSRIELYIGESNQIFGVVYDALGRLVSSKTDARRTEIPSIAILPQIGPLLQSEVRLSREYVLRSTDTNLASRHFRSQIYWMSEYFAEFKRLAEESWHHLQVHELDVELDPPDTYLSLQVRDTDFVAEVGWMGHGLQMWLQTMWFLSRSSAADTVILDEPDVYMHADLQRRLIRLLRNRAGQTLVATHSVEIMAEADPEDILIIDKTRRRSSFAAKLPVVQGAIDRIGGVHNIHLARLWGAQRCLHVEGKDVSILKALQDRLYPDSEVPFDIIPRLSIGGWSGWPYAIGSKMSLQNSAGDTIVAYCILDSDYHTEQEVADRYEEARRHTVQLHIWRLKEIEDYLLIPGAIARLISHGAPDGQSGPSSTEVLHEMDAIAEGEKNRVFDALAQEYLSRNRSGGAPAANRLARERVESAWKSGQGRRGLVSGKHVISRLSNWAQDAYGVSFGALRIAKVLRSEEIPLEMKSVIGAMERGEAFSPRLSKLRDSSDR